MILVHSARVSLRYFVEGLFVLLISRREDGDDGGRPTAEGASRFVWRPLPWRVAKTCKVYSKGIKKDALMRKLGQSLADEADSGARHWPRIYGLRQECDYMILTIEVDIRDILQ
jgi:hypothetical protein